MNQIRRQYHNYPSWNGIAEGYGLAVLSLIQIAFMARNIWLFSEYLTQAAWSDLQTSFKLHIIIVL